MRYVLHIQTAALAAVVALAGVASANDPCPTCGKGVTPTVAPKPACDNKISPLSEYHYYKRYCGPVISPNATYGVFQTQWRPWDGGTNQTAACATSTTSETPVAPTPKADAPKVPASVSPTPNNLPNVKPEVKPVTPPPADSNKEPIPAPKPAERGKGLLKRFGTAALISPGVYLIPANQ